MMFLYTGELKMDDRHILKATISRLGVRGKIDPHDTKVKQFGRQFVFKFESQSELAVAKAMANKVAGQFRTTPAAFLIENAYDQQQRINCIWSKTRKHYDVVYQPKTGF